MFILFCAALHLPGAATAGFLACQIRDCVQQQVPRTSCTRRILFFRQTDPVCANKVSALRAQAAAQYQACLVQQRIDQANCESLQKTRDVEQSTGGIATNDLFKANGVVCMSSSQCESGFCLPGPDMQRVVTSIPGKSSAIWYCAGAKANCSLPDKDGGVYGDILGWEGAKLVCQNPGRGLWGQFYPPE